jgi:hypothetical protein
MDVLRDIEPSERHASVARRTSSRPSDARKSKTFTNPDIELVKYGTAL